MRCLWTDFMANKGFSDQTLHRVTITCVSSRPARVDRYVELGLTSANPGWQVDAVDVAVEALAEDDSVERLVELDRDLHQVLLALDIEAGDLGHIRLSLWPRIILLLGGLHIGGCRIRGLRGVLLFGRLWCGGVLGWLRAGRLWFVGRPWLRLVGRLGLVRGLRWGRGWTVCWLLGPLWGRRPGLRLGSLIRLLLGRRPGLVLGRGWPRLRLRLVGRLWWGRPPLWGRGLVRRLLLGRRWSVCWLGWRRPVLGATGDHDGAGLDREGQRHRDRTAWLRLWWRRVVLGLGRGLGGSIRVDGGSLGGSIALLGYWCRGRGRLWGVVAVLCWGCSCCMFHVVASSMLAVVAMSSSVPLLGKDLLGQLALLGQLVISDERLISEVYPVLGRGEVTGHTDSLNYGNGLLLLGANLQQEVVRWGGAGSPSMRPLCVGAMIMQNGSSKDLVIRIRIGVDGERQKEREVVVTRVCCPCPGGSPKWLPRLAGMCGGAHDGARRRQKVGQTPRAADWERAPADQRPADFWRPPGSSHSLPGPPCTAHLLPDEVKREHLVLGTSIEWDRDGLVEDSAGCPADQRWWWGEKERVGRSRAGQCPVRTLRTHQT